MGYLPDFLANFRMHTRRAGGRQVRVGVIFAVFSGQVWAFLIFGGGVRGRWPKIFRGDFITVYRVEGFREPTEAFLGL